MTRLIKRRQNLLKVAMPAACFALMLAVSGCGPKSPDDQALQTAIQSKLYSDATARTANVKVAVANGVVTLTGDAPSSDTALQVVNLVNGTSGVKSVDNELKISGSAMASAPSTTASGSAPNTTLAQSTPPSAPVAPPAPIDDRRREERREERRRDDQGRSARPMAPPQPVTVTVPVGTDIGIRMIDGISSKTNTSGQTFRASLATPVTVNDQVVIPVNANASVLLSEAKGAGRIKGNSALEVRLVSIESGGRTYNVDTSVHDEVGKGRGKQTAVRSGIGAAAGAVIGAIAGGGKGAAIGSLAGGGAGAGFQLATHGQQVSIPSETRLTFRLQSPLVVTVRGANP